MPTGPTEQILNSSSSFIGLQSYTEDQAASFFGRDNEISNLTKLVRMNTLTIVFGKSGTGKTSLLNAGVFPLLRKNYCLPFRIRLEFNENSPDLVTQIKNVLKKEIDTYGFKVDSYPASETLWEYFHKELLWKAVTPILVFDQFEEIFTLANENPRFGKEELEKFWEELSDLAENSIPEKLRETFLNSKEKINYSYKNQKVKIVFSFREEYLPEFETITTKIPSLKTSRFRLLPMNGNQALEVITKTWKDNIKPTEAKKIVTYLTKESNLDIYELITIEPSLLSQVCAFIDKERIDEGMLTVSTELLYKYPPDKILNSIYNEAIVAGSKALPLDLEEKVGYNPLKELLEEKMITSDGFRTKYSLTGKDEPIRPGVEILKEKYFLRQELNAIELTHDVLTPLIKKDREKRRKETALETGKKKALRRAILILVASVLLVSAFWVYSLIKRGKAENEFVKYVDALENKKDSLEKEFLIKHSKDSKNNKGDRQNPVPPVENSDSLPIDSSLIFRIKDLQNDSTRLSNIIGQLSSKLTESEKEKHNFQSELTVTKRNVEDLQRENSTLKEELSKLNARIESLNKSLNNKDEQIRILRDSIIYLNQTIKKQGETINDLIKKGTGPAQQGNLRISIFDSTSKKILFNETLSVYIIPLNKQNNILLEQEEINAIMQMKDCTNEFEELLKKLGGYQKAFYSKGYYYFPQIINNGKYKIKICNILAGYYDLKMPVHDKKILWKRKNAPTIEINPGKF